MTNTTQNLEKTLHKLHHLTNKVNCANILILKLEELITKSYYRGYYDGFKDGYDVGEKCVLGVKPMTYATQKHATQKPQNLS